MSKIIIASSPIYGHFMPMRAIAVDLVRRGHDVTILSGREFRESAESAGAAFVPFTGKADLDLGELLTAPERLALPGGPAQFEWDMRHLVIEPMADQHRDLQRLIAEAGDEPVLVMSETGFFGGAALMLGAPGPRPKAFIGIGVVPFALSSQDTGPFGMGLPPDSSEEGRARKREAYQFLHEQVLGAAQAQFVATLAELGATRPAPFFLDMPILGPDRFLQLAIEELSYHRSDTPGHVSFVGSLPAMRSADVTRPDWWPDVEAAERVVVVTQGTVANEDLGNLVEPTLAALAELPVLVVATTGPRASVRDVPANARVAEFVPFEGLLPHADVLVTNGGFGGVQQALRHGTPLVLAGQTEEKFEGNIRVAATGAAINLATDTPAVADIRAAVETVLTDADYRKNAERLAAEYAKLDALAAVAQTVDHLAAS